MSPAIDQQAPIRVLVIHSVWDWITANRIARINADTRAAARYAFRHLYPLTAVDGDEHMDEQGFAQRLEEVVARHQPQLVVVHTGLAFGRHTPVYARVLPALAERHPELRFASDDPVRLAGAGLALPMADGDEVTEILDIVF